MTADLSAPLARLISTAEAIEGLRDLFAAEEPLDVIAARVAETAVAAIPHADAVSITVLSWPDARTAASTHEQALELDHQQYASGRGPCLEAAWQRMPVRAVIGEEYLRWPEFVEAAQRAGDPREFVGSAADRRRGSRAGTRRLAQHIQPHRNRIRSVRCRTHARLHRRCRSSDQQRRPLAELPRNSHPARDGAPVALRHRHGQRRSHSPARLRSTMRRSPGWWTSPKGAISNCAMSPSSCSTE